MTKSDASTIIALLFGIMATSNSGLFASFSYLMAALYMLRAAWQNDQNKKRLPVKVASCGVG